MKPFLLYILVAIFSVFIGSQITEGVLLLPYWQSLSSNEFYFYYSNFGHLIGGFYTFLTIIAAIIPIIVFIYCKLTKSKGATFALISSVFAILFVASFYLYFKDANTLFFNATLNDIDLKKELITWGFWHWGRIVLECFSLLFLILTFNQFKILKN